jgi:tripartite-type tricarboxylate transporter receptor subunit TctC
MGKQKMKILSAALALLLAFGLVTKSVHAQSAYPTRPITLVVPAPPGGQTDVVARIVAQHLAEKLGQPIVIENRAGAGTNIGTAHVARAAPDGYTLLIAAINFTANPASAKDTPYDPVKDFRTVVHLTSNPNILVVNVDSPYHSLQDLLTAAKAKPGQLTYGSAGLGSSMFLFMEMLKSMSNVDILHVPYQGSARANNDLMGGQIAMVFDSLPGALPLVEGKKLRAVAQSGAQRAKQAPTIPTVAEAGVKDFDAESWLGIVAPAGTPDDIVQKINVSVNEVLNMPAVRGQLEGLGARVIGGSSEQFDRFVRSQLETWKKVLASTPN